MNWLSHCSQWIYLLFGHPDLMMMWVNDTQVQVSQSVIDLRLGATQPESCDLRSWHAVRDGVWLRLEAGSTAPAVPWGGLGTLQLWENLEGDFGWERRHGPNSGWGSRRPPWEADGSAGEPDAWGGHQPALPGACESTRNCRSCSRTCKAAGVEPAAVCGWQPVSGTAGRPAAGDWFLQAPGHAGVKHLHPVPGWVSWRTWARRAPIGHSAEEGPLGEGDQGVHVHPWGAAGLGGRQHPLSSHGRVRPATLLIDFKDLTHWLISVKLSLTDFHTNRLRLSLTLKF